MSSAKRASPRLANICVAMCDYLNTKDAYIEELAEHCECSVPSIRRATHLLRNAGAPLRHVRNVQGQITEHYWRLDRKLKPGEAEAYATFVFLPEERAQKLLEVVQSAHTRKK